MLKELIILIKLLFNSKPSQVLGKELEVMEMKHFPFKGYKWMMWCGRMIYRKENEEQIRKEMLTHKFEVSKNHERIHLVQACYYVNNSWIKYYLSYLFEWLRHGFLAPMTANYYCSKFESEAYANEEDMEYCDNYNALSTPTYSIKHAKKKWKSLGGTSTAWKAYIKTL